MKYYIQNSLDANSESVEQLKMFLFRKLEESPFYVASLLGLSSVEELHGLFQDTAKMNAAVQQVFSKTKPALRLNLSEVLDCQKAFDTNYKRKDGSFLNNEHQIRWVDFRDSLLVGTAERDRLVFRFVHRYDTKTNLWGLTIERGSIAKAGMKGAITPEKFVLDVGYTLGLALQKDTYGHWYDGKYFTELNGGLTLGSHAQSVIFAWQEIQQLFCENYIGGTNITDYSIYLNSISPDYTGDATSKVNYPHGLAMIMGNNSGKLLDNVVVATFQNKAGDLNTICPPGCSEYYWPKDLPVAKSCF